MLLQIASIAILPDPLQFSLQFLETACGVGGHALEIQLPQNLLSFLVRHVGQHDFAYRGAVQRNGGSDAGVNAEMLGRVDLLDIHCCEAVPNREVNGLPGLLIKIEKIRQTETADVELPQRRLADGETRQSQVINTAGIAIQKARRLEIHQKPVSRADRESGKPGHLHGGKAALGLSKQLQQAQPALQRGDAVLALSRLGHGGSSAHCRQASKMKVRIIC